MKTSTIVLTLALCSCGHAAPSALPGLVDYSPEFQKEMKLELQEVRKIAPRTNEFIHDSIKLRDKVRAGHTLQKKGPFKLFRR
jgi:hypothetical protein